MRILVISHNHWAGYHIVTKFLEDGCYVDGIRNTQIDSGLEDFFGRNSHFQEVDQITKDYDLAVVINHTEVKNVHRHAERVMHIQTDANLNIESDTPRTTVIYAPYLIGEGMEMGENGLILDGDGRTMPDTDNDWQKKAIYIKDFLKVLMQWIKMSYLPTLIEIISVNDNLTNTKVEKKQVLLENRDINAVIKTIQTFNKQLR
ncbi:hypothetical protein [Oceanobacillus timonensis]|uniref:hypothetical protein n=1 Tax=Oceanobacillus timonensis TaxID=1926285 RepID=UPI0009BC19D9|nr:hypothetical protein [Oceanobacillus timonensis]